MRVLALLLVLLDPALGADTISERKVRSLLLLDKDLPISDAEYVAVKGDTSEDWNYAYFTFKARNSLREIVEKSRSLLGTRVSSIIFRDGFQDFPLIPKIPQEIAEREQEGIISSWYREPRIASVWCIGVKEDDGQLKVLGLVEFKGPPTNGNVPQKLFDRAGNRKSFQELFGDPVEPEIDGAESGPCH